MKKLLSVLLTLAMLLSMVAIPVVAETTQSTVIGYDPAISTAARTDNAANVAAATEITAATTILDANVTYYKIATPEGLAQFAVLMRTNTFAGKTVYLTADIDMLNVTYDPSAPQTTATTIASSPYFAGTFDGQGYVISNLHITQQTPSFSNYYVAGFFESLVNATVKNLVFNTNCVVESGNRVGTQWIGGLAGTISGTSLISNVYMGASVSGMTKIGGFYGNFDYHLSEATTITFEHCTNAGTVTVASGSAGGFAGHINTNHTFNYCNNIGTVAAYNNVTNEGVGGFVGRTNGNQPNTNLNFNNCYNSGAVETQYALQAGGFVGRYGHVNDTSTFTNAYNYGSVYGRGPVSSLYNTKGGTGTVINVTVNNSDTSAAGTNTVTSAVEIAALPAPAYTYNPATIGYSAAAVVKKDLAGMKNILNYSASASDTEYMIDTPVGLVRLAELVNGGETLEGKTVYLAADINMGNVEGFAPIGNAYTNPFKGIFDGQGHTIDYLTISESGTSVGLFGVINMATVKNLVVGANTTITTNATPSTANTSMVGLIATMHGISSVVNVYSAAKIDVTNVSQIAAGGIVGGELESYNYSPDANHATNNVIANCTFDGEVNGGCSAGGIMGVRNPSAQGIPLSTCSILNCYADGALFTKDTEAYDRNVIGGIVALIPNKIPVVVSNVIVNVEFGSSHVQGTVLGSDLATTSQISINLVSNATVYNCPDGMAVGGSITYSAVSGYTVSEETAPVVTAPEAAFPAAMVHGYQKSTSTYDNGGKTCISVRVIGSIDSSHYTEVGFKLRVLSTANTATVQDLGIYKTSTVYTALLAQDASGIGTVSISSIRDNGSAFYAATVNNLSSTLGTIVLEVTPYAIALDGSTEIIGDVGVYTIDCTTAANAGDSGVTQS